jgi:2-keto-4-pentenoate hydratase/2-oxohepta-3-ene-1,7-dioic acid hydratase in catechol pathway
MKFVRFVPDSSPLTWEDDLLGRRDEVSFGLLEEWAIFAVATDQDELLSLAASGHRPPTTVHVSLDEVRLLAPLRPTVLRDFMAFEDHAKGGASRRGEELDPRWYEIPISYKGNPRQILGPSDELAYPDWTEWLDFELEIAAVVGQPLRNATPEEATEAIAGYTIMNDWSARDVQRSEMAMRLGPARSKDFATSLGPTLATRDEVDPRDSLALRVRVDGEVWFEGSTAPMHWTFGQIISWVSQTEWVLPGDTFGSGTAFGGCGLDLDRKLPRTCEVELTAEGLGVLKTRVVLR